MITDDFYQSSYDKTLETLEKYKTTANFDMVKVENELNALYSYEGLGWAGRGMIKDAEISGSISAYEAFLARLRKYETELC